MIRRPAPPDCSCCLNQALRDRGCGQGNKGKVSTRSRSECVSQREQRPGGDPHSPGAICPWPIFLELTPRSIHLHLPHVLRVFATCNLHGRRKAFQDEALGACRTFRVQHTRDTEAPEDGQACEHDGAPGLRVADLATVGLQPVQVCSGQRVGRTGREREAVDGTYRKPGAHVMQ